jgi:hypothetical protein
VGCLDLGHPIEQHYHYLLHLYRMSTDELAKPVLIITVACKQACFKIILKVLHGSRLHPHPIDLCRY